MDLTQARNIAENILTLLRPFCQRSEIAGSVRRSKPAVGDIEIVVMPKDDLFEFSMPILFDGCKFIKNGPRYKQITLPGGINLDLFIVLPPAQWGVIFTLRSGPESFSRKCVTKRSGGGLLPSNCMVRDGQVWQNGEPLSMPQEEDFLSFIGVADLAPMDRE